MTNPAVTDLDRLRYEDIRVIDYMSHPAIPAPIAV